MREDSTPLSRFSRDTFPPTIHPILDRQTDRKILSLSLSLSGATASRDYARIPGVRT